MSSPLVFFVVVKPSRIILVLFLDVRLLLLRLIFTFSLNTYVLDFFTFCIFCTFFDFLLCFFFLFCSF